MKKILAAFCTLLILLPTIAFAAGPEVDAQAYVLMEKETGSLLLSQNEHEQLEPASVTKVMTLLLITEAITDGQLHLDDMITVSARACSMGGSQVYLKEGEQMSVSELLKCICVVSANDACVALAEAIAGSEQDFVVRMNTRAAELGMKDTSFVNCTGLPAEGHKTSAYDIALMSRQLIRSYPDIRKYTTIWTDSIRDGAFNLANTNKLIRFYDGATGLKTGSTDSAMFCLSATAERNGMELIAVILKSPTSAARFEGAKALLNYGFANYAVAKIYPDTALGTIPVKLGTKSCVQPTVDTNNSLLVQKNQLSALTKTVTLCESVEAPVTVGQKLGELTVTAGNENIAVFPIVAGEDIPRMTSWQLTHNLLCRALMAS